MRIRLFIPALFVGVCLTLSCDLFATFQPTPRPTALTIYTLPPLPTATMAPTETATPPLTATATITPTVASPTPRVTLSTAFPTEPNSIVPGAFRVRFAAGATIVAIEGNLRANTIDTYVLRAQTGQTMTVNVSSPSIRMLLQVSGADGNPLKTFGAGFSDWSGVLPKTQDYYIGVTTENNAGSSYVISISIPPPASGTRTP